MKEMNIMKAAKIGASALIAVGTIVKATLDFITNQKDIRSEKDEG